MTDANALVTEVVQRYESDMVLTDGTAISNCDHYHVGIEVSTGKKGDSSPKGKREIEDAVTQVLRGTFGFVNFLKSRPDFLQPGKPAFLLPMVCTTASLWVSTGDLSKVDLGTGKAVFPPDSLKPAPWLLYQYHSSPGLRHSVPPSRPTPSEFGPVMHALYTRTVAIVSPSGLEEFLELSSALRIGRPLVY